LILKIKHRLDDDVMSFFFNLKIAYRRRRRRVSGEKNIMPNSQTSQIAFIYLEMKRRRRRRRKLGKKRISRSRFLQSTNIIQVRTLN